MEKYGIGIWQGEAKQQAMGEGSDGAGAVLVVGRRYGVLFKVYSTEYQRRAGGRYVWYFRLYQSVIATSLGEARTRCCLILLEGSATGL